MVKTKDGTENWEGSYGQYAQTIIKVEMLKRQLGFRELTELLNKKFGISENERNIRNRVARATFTAAFFVMCLMAMECKQIEISQEPFGALY